MAPDVVRTPPTAAQTVTCQSRRYAAPTGPAQARHRAGLTLATAAAQAHVCEAYLRQVEGHGAPYWLARRLAAVYQCRIDLFLPRKEGSETPHKPQPAGRRRSGRQAPTSSRSDRDP